MTSLGFNYQKPPLFLPNQTHPPSFLINKNPLPPLLSHPTPPFSRLLPPPPLMSAGEAAAAASLPPYFTPPPHKTKLVHTHTHTLSFFICFFFLPFSIHRRLAGRGRRRRTVRERFPPLPLLPSFELALCVFLWRERENEELGSWWPAVQRPPASTPAS